MFPSDQQLTELWQQVLFFFGSLYLNVWTYFGIAPPDRVVVLSWGVTFMLLLIVVSRTTNFTSWFKRTVRRMFSPRSWFKYYRLQRGTQMDANERDGFLRQFVADGVTNFIEDAEYNGEMTREEANRWYEHIAHACGLPDLIRVRIERDKIDGVDNLPKIEKVIKAAKPKKVRAVNNTSPREEPPPPSEPIPTPPVQNVSAAVSALRNFKRSRPKPVNGG